MKYFLSTQGQKGTFFNIFCAVTILFLSGCDEWGTQKVKTETGHFSIKNESAETRSFELVINGRRFYHSIAEIAKDAYEYQKAMDTIQTTDTLKAIWFNTAYRTVHNTPLTGLDWFHHPILFYNSAGLGLCDDVANVNEAIWAWMGFPARTWYMEEHVVSEAYQGHRWKMYDSDLGVYYQGADSVLSFKDIEKNPDFLGNRKLRKEISERTETYDDNFWKYVAGIYRTTDDNVIEDWPPAADSATYDYNIYLPPGAEVLFGKALVDFPISLEVDAPNYYNLIFKCESIDHYKTNLFLIPGYIKGQGTIKLDGVEHRIEDLTPEILFEREYPIKTIELINATNVEIAYLVNGYIFNIRNKYYKLKIAGEMLQGLHVKAF